MVKAVPMRGLPNRLEILALPGRLVWPIIRTLCRPSSPAIGSLVPMEHSRATHPGCMSKNICWKWKKEFRIGIAHKTRETNENNSPFVFFRVFRGRIIIMRFSCPPSTFIIPCSIFVGFPCQSPCGWVKQSEPINPYAIPQSRISHQ